MSTICGIPVVQMNDRILVRLQAAQCPFIYQELPVTPANTMQTLWLLSPFYSPTSRWRRGLWLQWVRRKPYLAAVQSLSRYITSYEPPPPPAPPKGGLILTRTH